MKSLIFSILLILNLSLKAEDETPCEQDMEGLACNEIMEASPIIYNRCCTTSPEQRVPEDRDSVSIPDMINFERINEHISKNKISKEEGRRIVAQLDLGKAMINWSLCKANDREDDYVECGEKPVLEDFLEPKKRVRREPNSSPGDCNIRLGAKRAKCGGKRYIEENPNHVGETHDPDASLLILGDRNTLTELEDVFTTEPADESDSRVINR